MQRIFQQLADRFVVDTLANNATFQRFAVKTVDTFKRVAEDSAEVVAKNTKNGNTARLKSTMEQKTVKTPVEKEPNMISGFFAELRNEIRQELDAASKPVRRK